MGEEYYTRPSSMCKFCEQTFVFCDGRSAIMYILMLVLGLRTIGTMILATLNGFWFRLCTSVSMPEVTRLEQRVCAAYALPTAHSFALLSVASSCEKSGCQQCSKPHMSDFATASRGRCKKTTVALLPYVTHSVRRTCGSSINMLRRFAVVKCLLHPVILQFPLLRIFIGS